MKYQPPSIRTDTVLFTVMGILLLAQIRAGFEDIFFAGRLYNQIQCVLLARSLLDCQEPSVCFGLVVCPFAMEASLIWNLMLAGRSGENLLYHIWKQNFLCIWIVQSGHSEEPSRLQFEMFSLSCICWFLEPCSVVLCANHLDFNRTMCVSLTYQDGRNKFLLCYAPLRRSSTEKYYPVISFSSGIAVYYL